MRLILAFVLLRLRLMRNEIRSSVTGGGRLLRSIVQALVVGIIGLITIAAAVTFSMLAWRGGPVLMAEDETRVVALFLLRVILALPLVMAVFLPLVTATSRGPTARARFLLLPIRHGSLHRLELVAAAADPWILAAIPPVLVLAASVAKAAAANGGLLAGLGAGAIATVAALGLLTCIVTISSLVASLLQLALRDRRRAELFGLLLVTGVLVASLLPLHFSRQFDERRAAREETTETASGDEGVPDGQASSQDAEGAKEEGGAQGAGEGGAADGDRAASGDGRDEAAAVAMEKRWIETFPLPLQAIPSEAAAKAIAHAAIGRNGTAALGLAALLAQAAVLVTASRWTWSRLVTSPETVSRRRGRSARSVREWSLPGVRTGTAAVATMFVRQAVRTVAGKLAFIMPVIFVVIFAWTGLAFGSASNGQLGLLGAGMALLSWQGFLANQLAVDGPGLSRLVLAPVTDREIIRGKLVGGAALVVISSLLACGALALIRPRGGLVALLAAPLAALAAYVPLACAGAFLSILLPKAVDMSQLGKNSQPHQGAALALILITPFALGVPGLMVVVGTLLLGGLAPTLGLLAAWLGLMTLVSLPLTDVAAQLLAGRREDVLLAARRP